MLQRLALARRLFRLYRRTGLPWKNALLRAWRMAE